VRRPEGLRVTLVRRPEGLRVTLVQGEVREGDVANSQGDVCPLPHVSKDDVQGDVATPLPPRGQWQ
jgi:hypothetical protein